MDIENMEFKVVIRNGNWGHMPQDMTTQPGDEIVLEHMHIDAVMMLMFSRMMSMQNNSCDGMCHKCVSGEQEIQDGLIATGRAKWPESHVKPEREPRVDDADVFWSDVLAALNDDARD